MNRGLERRQGTENIATAGLQFRLDPDKIGWIYASLARQPRVELYKGVLPEPFEGLIYFAANAQNQLILAANLVPGEEFRQQFKETVGTREALAPLFQRYPQSEFTDDYGQLIVRKDDQVYGMIARVPDGRILLQRGGATGQLPLDEKNPVNSLNVYLNQFNLLVQRYVGAIWKASPDTANQHLQLVLDIPFLPAGALETYFSTFEIIGKEFRERPRPVSLDEDIGGYSEMKTAIKAVFLSLTSPEVSRKFGTQPFSNKFILVCGKEGTGKSLFPKALDTMLRAQFGDGFEHFRLLLGDMLLKYGPNSATIVETILNHIRENEKGGVPTLLHLDSLEQLIPPHRRLREVGSPSHHINGDPSDAEFEYSMMAINPVLTLLRNFGREMGVDNHHIIVYGESRTARDELPESLQKVFRRIYTLDAPTTQDLADILRVQIRITRSFAQKGEGDPFQAGIEDQLVEIASHTDGLVGRDVQQALSNITIRNQGEWDGKTDVDIHIGKGEIIKELARIKSSKNVADRQGPIGLLAYGRGR